MELDLLTLVTSELLEKFGAGNHKPGSGSAAAFQGMVSAQLLITVIELTNEPKRRRRYKSVLPSLLTMQAELKDKLYPRLVELFNEDSIQFGKTIELRKRRNKERDALQKNSLAKQALKELKVSIALPLEIADICVRIGSIGESVFDYGFQSARGDSQVALSGAVASLAGCLSIIQLNLSLFGADDYKWVKSIKRLCDDLRVKYNELNLIASQKMDTLAKLVENRAHFFEEIDNLMTETRRPEALTNKELEQFVRQFQLLSLKNKDAFWTEETSLTYRDIISPSVIFQKVLGYSYDDKSNLGGSVVDGVPMNVAGIIDQNKRIVRISNHTPIKVQNFTAAHELGHALLHTQTVMHRDLPLEGLDEFVDRPFEEKQADRFATYFLMPEKQVRKRFKEVFFTEEFSINSDTTFRLTGSTKPDLRKEFKDLQGLCLKLASTGTYDGEDIIPLSDFFSVSDRAMAIRIEQLGLAKF